MMKMNVHLTQRAVGAGFTLPMRAHPGDACFDLRTLEGFEIAPGESKTFPTGLVFDLPPDPFELPGLPGFKWIMSAEVIRRTGLSLKGLIEGPVVFDGPYRPKRGDLDGWRCGVRNIGQNTLHFKDGDRLVQLMLRVMPYVELQQVDADGIQWNTERGAKRFGSTGLGDPVAIHTVT